MKHSSKNFTAVIKKEGKWYIGWVEEVPGVNTQGRTIKEVRSNLKEALALILETNRMMSLHQKASLPKKSFFIEPLTITFA